MQKIMPFLWFDDQAEEAMNYHVSIFKDSRAGSITHYGDAGPGPKGSVMTASFELEGQRFTALNGGPHFKFTEAISFVVNCETQEEVDELWDKLSEGGQTQQCGWLKDKFGLSWQIIPSVLMQLMKDPDPQKSQRVMEAMLQMTKIDIAKLRQAYEPGAGSRRPRPSTSRARHGGQTSVQMREAARSPIRSQPYAELPPRMHRRSDPWPADRRHRHQHNGGTDGTAHDQNG